MTANTYTQLNAMINLFDEDGNLQLDKDKEAARAYFLEHVNPNTVFFHSLEEKTRYMLDHNHWDYNTLDLYTQVDIKRVFQRAYGHKFRFPTFVGALKFYQSYACKTPDGERFLERYEDRVSMVALHLAQGQASKAMEYVDEIIEGRFQPATPTFLNAGRGNAGDLVSCFLLRLEDNMESIGRSMNDVLQLSKRGGGVAILLTNLRESGARIKAVDGAASGVVPVMKLYEDAFSYANQLGARQGAGAVYLHAHHPDILRFLDTKRENADEKIRIKTLSLGVVVPDITFELARENKDMYLFSPYDVEREYGQPLSDIGVTANYQRLVDNPRIRKTKISARKLFQTIAEIQFESGYPYLVFEDTVNRANPIRGWINMSNLCSEILQVNKPSQFAENLGYAAVGQDISCNLGSLNIAKVMEHPETITNTITRAVDALTAVSDLSTTGAVPSVAKGNWTLHSIGLGQMNLHGYLASVGIEYGSKEALDFVNSYFGLVRYHAITRSMELARDTGESFIGFNDSEYANGDAFIWYYNHSIEPTTDKVRDLFGWVTFPNDHDWAILAEQVQRYGMYHAYLLAVPPTGNISYVNGSTSSIHPVTAPIEIRKEGKLGRVYYPAYGLTNDNLHLYQDAYDIGYEKIIDTYAAATPHTDQGLSLTLFFKDTATTRDINRAQIYAWRKGIKTLYYIRIRQDALEGTGVDACVSCTL